MLKCSMDLEKNDDGIPKFSIIQQKRLKDMNKTFNSLEFAFGGDKLIYSVQNRICVMIYCEEGIKKFRIRCNDGCDVVKVISNSLVAYSNTKNFNLTLIDFNEIKRVAKFEGHIARISSISTFGDGSNNNFMTSSDDGVVKFWDRRNRYENFSMGCSSPLLTCYHPTGLLFALGIDSHILQIHHINGFVTPIHRFKLEKLLTIEWRQLKFSKEGKYIVVTTNSSLVHVFDGSSAVLLQSFTGECDETGFCLEYY